MAARHNLGSWATNTNLIPASVTASTASAFFLGVMNAYQTGNDAYLIIYNRALTDAEISKNYAYLKSYLKKQRGISLA